MSELTKRELLAGMTLSSLLSNPHANPSLQINVESAVRFTDALLAELARTEPKPVEPVADADGWIAHNGGEMPCDGGLLVFVKFRDGDTDRDPTPADEYEWEHFEKDYDITAWRPAR